MSEEERTKAVIREIQQTMKEWYTIDTESMIRANEKLKKVKKLSIGFHGITELQNKCLYYEDLIEDHEDVSAHTTVREASRDLEQKMYGRKATRAFFDIWHKNVEDASTFRGAIEHFDRELSEMERKTRRAGDDFHFE